MLYIVLTFFIILMVRIVIPYGSLNTDTGFLRIKQQYVHNRVWLVSFFIHALTSIVCLFAGFTQFSKTFLNRYRIWHKRLGKVYVFNVLFLAAPTGFVLGLYANGHEPSRIGFVLLSLLWFGFTYGAWTKIKTGNINSHRKHMIRSYALTLSAITLRIWKFGLANTIAPDPLDLYQMVTWLGFVPNMIVAELLIFLKARDK